MARAFVVSSLQKASYLVTRQELKGRHSAPAAW